MFTSQESNTSCHSTVKILRILGYFILFIFACLGFIKASEIRRDLHMSEKSEDLFGNVYPDVVMRSGNSILNIYYFAKGTHYEGYHGILFENGQEIYSGNTIIKFKNFDIKFFGEYSERLFSYDKSGWLPLNPALIPRSSLD